RGLLMQAFFISATGVVKSPTIHWSYRTFFCNRRLFVLDCWNLLRIIPHHYRRTAQKAAER
ncbi:hypothetical protein ABTE44_19550, partial [Acinetobacter baumannii]